MLKFSLLDISRGPQIEFCTTGPLSRDWSGNSRFECRISNYSDYVRVLVVEDNKIEYNESSDALSFSCEAQISDRSLATCTVSISSSAHYSKNQYKLCAGYNGSVAHTTQLQCSDNLNVTFTGRSGEVMSDTPPTSKYVQTCVIAWLALIYTHQLSQQYIARYTLFILQTTKT